MSVKTDKGSGYTMEIARKGNPGQGRYFIALLRTVRHSARDG